MNKIFFNFIILLIILNFKVSAEAQDFFIESVEEVETEIKTYEDNKVIIDAKLPRNIEVKARLIDESDQKIFYNVWFEKDNEIINCDALIHVEFKELNYESGRIVKIEIDITDTENKEKLQSIWFSVEED